MAMGRVAGSYGVRGWIRVAPSGGGLEGLAAAKEWWIDGREYAVEEVKAHSGTLLARLGGIEIREAALKLKGAEVSVRRESLPEAGEGHYYLADLIGLEVVNGQGEKLGVVKRMFTNGAQDVMELSGARERLLPWVPTVVKNVDLLKRQIEVEWEADW
jgi:16S rRNA processing protein RimM